MRSHFINLVVIALTIGGLPCNQWTWAQNKPNAAKADNAKPDILEGKWKVVKIEGRNPTKTDGVTVTIKDMKISLAGLTGEPLDLTFKIDPSTKPKAIDITLPVGTLLGIYQIDGNKLTVCYSELQESEKGKRPTELSAPEKSYRYLWVLERQK